MQHHVGALHAAPASCLPHCTFVPVHLHLSQFKGPAAPADLPAVQSTSNPSPWSTDPTPITQGSGTTTISAIGGRKFSAGLLSAQCPPYFSPLDSSLGCNNPSAGSSSPPSTLKYGTFSYIDAVYSTMDSNYLCNGLAHGGAWLLSAVGQNKLGNLVGQTYAGFSPGTNDDFSQMFSAFIANCQANSNAAGCFGIFGQ